jgi:predicted ribosomally synthesized peptide with nif11-like leader
VLAFHQQAADEVVGATTSAGRAKKGLGEVFRKAWWLWGWLDKELLKNADRSVEGGLYKEYKLSISAMSEDQLAALLAKLKDDEGLQEKLRGAADLDAALAIAKDAGFDLSKDDWLKYQASQTIELSNEELEFVTGGGVVGEGLGAPISCFCKPTEDPTKTNCDTPWYK